MTDFKYQKAYIIDDNDIDLFVNENLLKITSFAQEIITFNEAKKALDLLKQSNFNDLPDVILLDISMPEMNGLQFLEQMEEILNETGNSNCAIILLTSSINPDELNKGKASKCVKSVISKPLKKQDLLSF